jgi:hypothetical protein
MDIFKKRFLNHITKNGYNSPYQEGKIPISFAFRYNKQYHLNLSTSLFKTLIANSNLNYIDENYLTPFEWAIRYAYQQQLPLTKQLWIKLINNTDFSDREKPHKSTIITLLSNYKKLPFKISEKKFIELLKRSNLKPKTNPSPLLMAMGINRMQELNFTEKIWDYLFENSDLNAIILSTHTTLPIQAIQNYKNENLNFSKNHWNIIYNSVENEKNKELKVTFTRLLAKEIFENNFNHFSPEQISKIFDGYSAWDLCVYTGAKPEQERFITNYIKIINSISAINKKTNTNPTKQIKHKT